MFAHGVQPSEINKLTYAELRSFSEVYNYINRPPD